VEVRARVVPGSHVAICAAIVQRSDRKLAKLFRKGLRLQPICFTPTF